MASQIANIYNNNCQSQSKLRRKFTLQEDQNLKFLIFHIGMNNWVKISELMPGRTAKQCRDRFYNYLSEPHRIEPWDSEEDDILLNLLSKIGPKWVEISKYIPGRSGNDVKNRWHKHLCKKYSYLKDKCVIAFSKNDEQKVSSHVNIQNVKIDLKTGNDYDEQKKYSISALLI